MAKRKRTRSGAALRFTRAAWAPVTTPPALGRLLAIVVALAFLLAPTAIAAGTAAPEGAGQARDAAGTDRLVEYGVTLAFRGDVTKAESVFVKLLSIAPRDARALNNLGNLYLMNGDSEVAMAFYARAQKSDTADAGIVLNRSVALMLSGNDAAASTEAARAVKMAGGLERAGSLLSLRSEQMAESKEAKTPSRTYLSKNEVMALLKGAKTAVPPGSTGAAKGAQAAPTTKVAAGAKTDSTVAVPAVGTGAAAAPAAKPKSWRSAGLRASDFSEIATSLYWKM